MELDREGKEEVRELIEDFMRFVERLEKESDARRAVSGEPATRVLIGRNPEQGMLVVIDPARGKGTKPEP